MTSYPKTTIRRAAWAGALLLASGAANAALCTGVSPGTSSTSDVALGGFSSDQCVVSTVNPQQGAGGNTSGFSTQFGGGWSLLSKIDAAGNITPNPATFGGVTFNLSFAQASGKTGTWSLVTDKTATFDLVFAMHASNRSDAFLFDDETTVANVVENGTWQIKWINAGGQVPNYSNLTLFVRDVVVTPVPEPETWAMLVAGLGAIGFMRRRSA